MMRNALSFVLGFLVMDALLYYAFDMETLVFWNVERWLRK